MEGDIGPMFTNAIDSLPKPIRRVVNLLRRIPFFSTVFRGRPLEKGIRLLYSEYIATNDVVVEVGARMGDGTRLLAGIARHVYSFEPSRTSFTVLKVLTRTQHNVDVYNLALSDHHGEAHLYRDRSFSGVASLKKLNLVSYVAREKVTLSTLDGINFRLCPTTLVVDCEGSELEVLRGGRKLLAEVRSVLVETHILSDGCSTMAPVRDELSRFFPTVKIDQVGNESWVIAQR